jgi:hypothetical protein
MAVGVFTLMTVGEWWSKLLEVCVPMWISRFKLYQMRGSLSKTTREIWSARSAFGDNFDKPNEQDTVKIDVVHQAKLIDRRERHALRSRSACWEEALKSDYSVTLYICVQY